MSGVSVQSRERVDGHGLEEAGRLLPCLEPPLPDELFGSWLSRQVVFNSISSVQTLVMWLRLPFTNVTLLRYDGNGNTAFLDDLARVLRLSSDPLVQSTTTRPFWECFIPPDPDQESGTASENKAGGSAKDDPNRYVRSFRGNSYWLRFCPTCYRQDTDSYGAPYIRRSHQLWGTHVCHEHGMRLIDTCSSCGTGIQSALRVGKIAADCVCGVPIIRSLNEIPEAGFWARIARFEHECLIGSPGALRREAAGKVAVTFVRQLYPIDERRSLRQLITGTLGPEAFDLLTKWPGARALGRPHRSPVISYKALNPPTIAALFAICNVDYAEAVASVLTRQPDKAIRRAKRMLKDGKGLRLAIPDARRLLLPKSQGGQGLKPGHCRLRHKNYFWLLVLKDFDWLHTKFGSSVVLRRLVVPTVEHDRAKIMEAGQSPENAREAIVRALIRDRNWLLTFRSVARRERREEERRQLQVRLLSELPKLFDAWKKMPGRPVQWTMARAAELSKVSPIMLRQMASKNSELRKLATEESETFKRRKLQWALAELVKHGKKINASELTFKASIPARVGDMRLAKEVMAAANIQPKRQRARN